MVSKRKKLVSYLEKTNPEAHAKVMTELGL
jgi:ribosomal protein S15P/S13E